MLFRKKVRSAKELLHEELRKEYEATDFGRRYGWWLCLRGQRIADLNYRRWESSGQFWCEYRLFAFDTMFTEVGFDPDRWCHPDISLESRYAEGFTETRILMASHGDSLVSIRSICIPEDVFMLVARRFRKQPPLG